jgi:hypothetical protein
MSGSVTTPPNSTFSTAGFSDAEKADIRRFCGYPPYGAGAAGFQGWRFFQAYGLLEYRIGQDSATGVPNMAPSELANIRYYLSLLYPIEAAVAAMYATIEVDTAASFKRNSGEYSDRMEQYNGLRRQLCSLAGTNPGPDLGDGKLRIRA